MKLSMAKDSLFATLLHSPRWISASDNTRTCAVANAMTAWQADELALIPRP